MRLALERRAERSIVMALASPLIAIVLTLATGAALFALLGKPPVEALKIYFLDPLMDPWALQEIAVKATPLVLIAVGLALCSLANAWNIGAEGQFLLRAIAGAGRRPIPDWDHLRRGAGGEDARRRRRLLGAACDAPPRRARRRALRGNSGP